MHISHADDIVNQLELKDENQLSQQEYDRIMQLQATAYELGINEDVLHQALDGIVDPSFIDKRMYLTDEAVEMTSRLWQILSQQSQQVAASKQKYEMTSNRAVRRILPFGLLYACYPEAVSQLITGSDEIEFDATTIGKLAGYGVLTLLVLGYDVIDSLTCSTLDNTEQTSTQAQQELEKVMNYFYQKLMAEQQSQPAEQTGETTQ